MSLGTLSYGAPPHEIQMEERLLAHVKVVIIDKLRRNESFLMSWEPAGDGSGRTSAWMHPSIPLVFTFPASRPPRLNQNWLELMAKGAMSSEGLRIMPEPPET